MALRCSRRKVIGFGALSAVGLLAACATPAASPTASPDKSAAGQRPADATSPAPSSGQTQAPAGKQASKVRFAISPVIFADGFRQIALTKGFFKEAGLDVELTVVDQGGTVMIRGLTADQFDIASMGPDPVFPTSLQGGGAKIVGTLLQGLFYGIYSKREYNSLAELKGKQIGISAPRSLPDVLLQATLYEFNLNPDDFERVNVGGSPAIYKAVEAGKVEAGVSNYDYLKAAEASPNVKLLVPMSDVLPKYVTLAKVASDNFLNNRPDVLQEFLTQQTRGARYALEHKDETVALAAEKTAQKPEDIAWEFDLFVEKKILNPNLEIPQESMEYLIDLAVKVGQIPQKVSVDSVYDGRFAKKTVEVLGPYKQA